ncbi:MAG: phospholipase D-like domain-containing protein [Steroidobacteraceae bacterium]
MNRWFQVPMRDGNRFTLLSDAHVYFARMLAAIDASQHYVLAEFYLVESGRVIDRFIAAFARAAARGICVRVLFDAFGARGLKDADRARLRAAGVDLVFFNVPRWRAFPRMFVRDHRKLLVVDGTAGFTGGAGLTDVFSPDVQPDSSWSDCMVEIAGPVLDDWHALFARTWKRCAHRELDVVRQPSAALQPGERGRVAASAGLGTKEVGRSVIKRVRKAKIRVWIATAYFWPSNRLRRALRRAARRGVDVRLLLPSARTDAPVARGVGRLFYARLLSSGVAIYEYQPSFLHAKLVLCDDWVSIGSSNLDRWEILWNLDANQEIDSPAFARQVEGTFVQIFDRSVVLRDASDVERPWSALLWRLLARAILAWSTRAVSRLRR